MSIAPQGWQGKRMTGKLYGPFKNAQKGFFFVNGLACITFVFTFIGAFHNYNLDVMETAGSRPAGDGAWASYRLQALSMVPDKGRRGTYKIELI